MNEIAELIPNGGVILLLVGAIAAVVSAFVPDDKMPKWLAAVINALALNVGKAKNKE
jgi:tetrahydromethanopterin S-methyltransferase subunit C